MREVMKREQSAVLAAQERRHLFDEVIRGFDFDQAMREADRCIQCKQPKCQAACPLSNKIPQWIGLLKKGDVNGAAAVLAETSPVPEICSRLCPQERLCEGGCVIGIKHEPVSIGLLERFVADHRRTAHEPFERLTRRDLGDAQWVNDLDGERFPGQPHVAVVGSGPAGLAAAGWLVERGVEVTVFERSGKAGGVLEWIPRFKMPPATVARWVDRLEQAGVTFQYGASISSWDPLFRHGYDAVVLAIGASGPVTPPMPGGEAGQILTATEFLRRAHGDCSLPLAWEPIRDLSGRRVVVLGGGDSAMDCVRTAIRLRAKEVRCVYRRDEANMPGSKKELVAAKEEGARFLFLTAPQGFKMDRRGNVSHVLCSRMTLGEPDASGRRSVMPMEGTAFHVEADLVVTAFGFEVEGSLKGVPPGFYNDRLARLRARPETGATAVRGVFAAGDCVTGPLLVSTSVRSGLTAAQGVIRFLTGESWDTLAPVSVSPSGG